MVTKSSTLKALYEQVVGLEAVVGGCNANSTLFVRVAEAFEELRVQCGLIESKDKYVEK